jgi:hypothetical protein
MGRDGWPVESRCSEDAALGEGFGASGMKPLRRVNLAGYIGGALF